MAGCGGDEGVAGGGDSESDDVGGGVAHDIRTRWGRKKATIIE